MLSFGKIWVSKKINYKIIRIINKNMKFWNNKTIFINVNNNFKNTFLV
jgi:hypothetical protein